MNPPQNLSGKNLSFVLQFQRKLTSEFLPGNPEQRFNINHPNQ